MSDGPDDWKENGSTADQINEYKHFLPEVMALLSLFRLFYYDIGNVSQDLVRNWV